MHTTVLRNVAAVDIARVCFRVWISCSGDILQQDDRNKLQLFIYAVCVIRTYDRREMRWWGGGLREEIEATAAGGGGGGSLKCYFDGVRAHDDHDDDPMLDDRDQAPIRRPADER